MWFRACIGGATCSHGKEHGVASSHGMGSACQLWLRGMGISPNTAWGVVSCCSGGCAQRWRMVWGAAMAGGAPAGCSRVVWGTAPGCGAGHAGVFGIWLCGDGMSHDSRAWHQEWPWHGEQPWSVAQSAQKWGWHMGGCAAMGCEMGSSYGRGSTCELQPYGVGSSSGVLCRDRGGDDTRLCGGCCMAMGYGARRGHSVGSSPGVLHRVCRVGGGRGLACGGGGQGA